MNDDPKTWESKRDLVAKESAKLFEEFVKTISMLRHPEHGCPWDLKQNHETLRQFMIEEAYEAAEAMLAGDGDHLLDELGDVLLQVVLNAQVAQDLGKGDIREVVKLIDAKMRRRHPHVFDVAASGAKDIQEIRATWNQIKMIEKNQTNSKSNNSSVLGDCKKIFPALTQSYKIGICTQQLDFDWNTPHEVIEHLRLELDELTAELSAPYDGGRVKAELADCFFTLAQLSRHLGYEPEVIAQEGNLKFMRRFEQMEKLAKQSNADIRELDKSELEALWSKAKLSE